MPEGSITGARCNSELNGITLSDAVYTAFAGFYPVRGYANGLRLHVCTPLSPLSLCVRRGGESLYPPCRSIVSW